MFHVDRLFDPARLREARPTKRSYAGLLNLSSNELHHPLAASLVREFFTAVDHAAVSTYPYWPGIVEVVARSFGQPPERVWITAGSDQGVRVLVQLAAARCRRLVLQTPSYATYAAAAAAEGLEVERVLSVGRTWQEEIDTLCGAAARREASLVAVANPHGFIGRWIPLEGMARLATECERLGHLLVVDEAYTWFAGDDHRPLLERFSNLVLLRSFSKGFGMAGLRFAALLAAPEVVEHLARSRSMAEVSGLSGAFVAHCVARRRTLERVWRDIARERELAVRAIAAMKAGWACPDSSANFQLVDTGDPGEAERVVAELERRGIAVRSLVREPSLASCFRFTVGDASVTRRLLGALESIEVAA